MTREELLARLAPCGLNCGACLAFAGGPIHTAAVVLSEGLGPNFANYAKRFEFMNPVFADYPAFARFLDFLVHAGCGSCRGEGCLLQNCTVQACVKSRGVDFCFQCPEFPCTRHGLTGALAERWRVNNERLRLMGPEVYFAAVKDKPRYP